ncbi:MAG: hypothetical protein WCV59_00910 [Parcubacteria group bacterium]|jgi:hypothetical protein
MRIIAKAIQYLMLKIMKRLGPSDDDRPAVAAADQLLDKLLPSAFAVFRDERFREVCNFGKISQVEHDRIFNELEVSAIILCQFCIDDRMAIIGNRDFHFWETVRENMPKVFVDKLLEYGVKKSDADLYFDLIKMRHDQYSKIADGNRDHMENDKLFSEYKDSQAAMDTLNRVQAIIVGTADHIRRGKLKKGDELMRLLRSWLFPLDMEISKFIRKL